MHSNSPAPDLTAQWTPWVWPAVIRRRRRRVRRWRWVFDALPDPTDDERDWRDIADEPETPAADRRSH